MTEISYTNWIASSDTALIRTIGAFIKHHRVQQNKTQSQLAKEAGIVRSTLSLFERGENTSLLVFIQLLRALKLLNMLQEFQVKEELTPLQLAKIEQSGRIRAKRNMPEKKKNTPETDW
jgi:transcriptional regulator with XRE-family HTH domain